MLEVSQPAVRCCCSEKGTVMRDMQAHLEKLRAEASECEAISNLATHPMKRDLFAKLAEHHRKLAVTRWEAILNLRWIVPVQDGTISQNYTTREILLPFALRFTPCKILINDRRWSRRHVWRAAGEIRAWNACRSCSDSIRLRSTPIR
jgi:hypothetical protein